MKKEYIKPEIEIVVVMPHSNLLIVSELNINDDEVNENDYDSLL